jgi:FKBP-type peptidyl-prolyl cis-trans isomerase FklB
MRLRIGLIAATLVAAVALGAAWNALRAQEAEPAAEPAAEAAPEPAAQAALSPEAEQALPTETDRVSYAIGVNMGRNFKRQFVELNPQALARGLADVFAGGEVLLTDEQMGRILADFQRRATENLFAKHKERSEQFLAENAKREGVKVTESGLQYQVLQEGTGRKPAADDTVVVNYVGSLADGTEFDSSYRRGQPAEFTVGQVIPGWVEALQMMKKGAKWKLFIPSDLAYGMRPPPGSPIPPNAALVFEVELLDIVEDENVAEPDGAAQPADGAAQPADGAAKPAPEGDVQSVPEME